MTGKQIRPAQVAGTFYPSNPVELKTQLENLFKEAQKLKIESSQQIKLLIVPHAGYIYSGSVAAAGFNQLNPQTFQRVVLLGVSHQSWFEGAALDDHEAWETPLGSVLVDQAWAEKIANPTAKIQFSGLVHLAEHSLEVQLPFLQKKLAQFKIVPILLGGTDDQLLTTLARKLQAQLDDQTLIVISSDLSHYPNYEIAQQVDQATIKAILTGDPNQWKKTVQEQTALDYPNLDTVACGAAAIKTGLYLGQLLGGQWHLIQYANSGDVSGDYGRVVGYASLGFTLATRKNGSESSQT